MSDGASVVESWPEARSAAGGVGDRSDEAREPAEAAEEREWVRRCRQGDTVALDRDHDVSDADASREGFEPEVVKTPLQGHALLAHLGEDLCVTLLLREVAGLRYAEIAHQLGLPIGTALSPAADGKSWLPAHHRPISVGAK